MNAKARVITRTRDTASQASTHHLPLCEHFPLLWTEWQNQVANREASRVGHKCCPCSQGVSRALHGSILSVRSPPRPESASQPRACEAAHHLGPCWLSSQPEQSPPEVPVQFPLPLLREKAGSFLARSETGLGPWQEHPFSEQCLHWKPC